MWINSRVPSFVVGTIETTFFSICGVAKVGDERSSIRRFSHIPKLLELIIALKYRRILTTKRNVIVSFC